MTAFQRDLFKDHFAKGESEEENSPQPEDFAPELESLEEEDFAVEEDEVSDNHLSDELCSELSHELCS